MPSDSELISRFQSNASAGVPAVEDEQQRAAYSGLAQRLYDELKAMKTTPEQRANAPMGRLAAALWARVAEWEDRSED